MIYGVFIVNYFRISSAVELYLSKHLNIDNKGHQNIYVPHKSLIWCVGWDSVRVKKP